MHNVKKAPVDTEQVLRGRPTIDRDSKERFKLNSLRAEGHCHHCERDLPKGKLFCNAKCNSAYNSA